MTFGAFMTGVSALGDCSQILFQENCAYLCGMFSKTFGYAVRAVAYVSKHGTDGNRVGLLDISSALEIPHHFLGKVMQDLVRHGIIDSAKGPHGGFFANERSLHTPLTDILKITDGSLVLELCVLGIHRCNAARPCVLHHEFATCKSVMVQAISTKTIADILDQIEKGEVFIV